VTRRLTIGLAALALAAGGCGGDGDGDVAGNGGGSAETTSDEAARAAETVERTTRVEVVEQQGGKGGFDARAIYRRASPGVVTIISVFEGDGGGGILPGGDDEEDEDPQSGLGSGFVVDEEGEIATNAHVVTQGEGRDITEAKEVYVKFADDNQVPAEIVGFDPNADVALLKLKEKDGLTIRPLPLGSSAAVKVGEPVAAIGSPFGEEQSLSVGVVSATDRAIESLTGFDTLGAVQTDAAINQGNSGGPLLDGRGDVIGINAQIRTRSGGGEGVGYAIPVDQVKRSLDQIREGGKVKYAYLGVATTAVYPQLAEKFGLGTTTGAWVQEVVKGGPAEKAGLKAGKDETRFQARPYRSGGDVVTKVGPTRVRTENDLGRALTRYKPGDEVTLEIYRGGKRQTVEVTVDERPAETEPRG
jgi:S1-C subfamily serine protease